jgi:hypothetical protein
MSDIRDIWKETTSGNQQPENVPLAILEKQAKSINEEAEKTNIISAVFNITNSAEPKIKHVLYLFPRNGNNYNYRFIEFTQPIDSFYPVTIQAYQNGDIHFGDCGDENEIYSTLTKIFQDPRRNIVFEQLKNIGATIQAWNEERSKE